MTAGFIDPLDPKAPADLMALAAGFAAPRVAIARAGAPLPMAAAEEAT